MNRMRLGSGLFLSLLGISLVVLVGCSKDDPKADQSKKPAVQGQEKPIQVASGKKVEDHSGWWCEEHGIPEAECSMCSAKVAKECKAKGDWCEKHDRAKSQCFICDPSLKEKFAAKYRAKYGKEPPPIQEEGGEEKKAEKK
jgi:hypothetical protein